MDMCRTPRIEVVAPRIRTRTDGYESILSSIVGDRMSATCKVRIQWRVVLIFVVQIAASRISLPDFDERVPLRTSVFVQYSSTYNDALANRLTSMLSRHVKGFRIWYPAPK